MKEKDIKTLRIRVYGVVQGVGFRPTVSRHAVSCGICGYVCNKGPYVEIVAQGTGEQTECFLELLKKKPPRRAAILKINVHPQETKEPLYPQFEIIESEKTSGEIFISPDIAICEECKKELFDPENRRYLHPFINCTCCGPRLTILDALPYDRERTSMKKFPMCPECETEYYSPSTRRYDAQPVCCQKCGPQVYLLGSEKCGREAILIARKTIAEGGIIAVKGIGGFHLCCDATSEEAVGKLRRLKNRPMKPFAIMMKDMDVVHRECEITQELEEILDGHQKPILLLKRKENGKVADICAPDNARLGVMLPYAPIQLLLFTYDDGLEMPDCFVMTSGNESGAPICRDDGDALESLSHLCDVILSNDRDIRLRADDTVMDVFEGQPYMIRRSRGYAPLPFMVTDLEEKNKGRCVLGIGGELKNSFTLATGNLFYPSPYIGDLADIRTVGALKESLHRMETLLEVKPELAACDLHPLYHSVEAARELNIPLVQVQHHYAHILSCMAENDYLEPVIGVSFDGTGYGTDKTIWGGEILLADTHGFTRMASISPFLQIGGDASAREGWRIAAAMIAGMSESLEDAWKTAEPLGLCDRQTFQIQYQMGKRRLNAVESTSAGRLFDAVSAILGIRRSSSFEGEASITLQFWAEKYLEQKENGKCRELEPDGIELTINKKKENAASDTRRMILDTEDLVRWIICRKTKGEEISYLAYVFHEMLAEMITMACTQIREAENVNAAALSGGVFQNTLLLGMCKKKLESEGFQVFIHHMIPPNDGGISIGQALYAACNLE